MNGLRDYGTGQWLGGDEGCDHTTARSRGDDLREGDKQGASKGRRPNTQQCCACGAVRVDQQLGLEPTIEAYLAALVQVFREVHRVLRDDGTFWCNMGDSYSAGGGYFPDAPSNRNGSKQSTQHGSIKGRNAATLPAKNLLGMPWRLALALQADGWILRSEIIWHKLNPMPESVQDRPSRAHEQVFLFAKQGKYFYDGEAVKEETHETSGWARQRANGVNTWLYNNTPDRIACTGQRIEASTFGTIGTRALRSVLSLASEPFSGSHFATFPTALVRRCLLAGTSAHGVCRACKAPWRRVVESQGTGRVYVAGQCPSDNRSPYGTQHTGAGSGALSVVTRTTGWSPTCTCGAPGDGQSTILDPFVGSGTVPLVARELGHHGVGLDLSMVYLQHIARKRLGLAALAAWEGRPVATPQAVYTDLPLFAEGDQP